MTIIEELKPNAKPTLMSLLESIGYATSDWGSPSNPKYCYEWCYRQDDLLVLTLWHSGLMNSAGEIQYRFNGDEVISAYASSPLTKPAKLSTVIARSSRVTDLLNIALEKKLGVRAIICDGEVRSPSDPPDFKSQVKTRMIDPLTWKVSLADDGAFILTRGSQVEAAYGGVGSSGNGERLLVLAENEVNASDFAWKDVTGERYHFPNMYKNKIVPGTRFVYYRGSRRSGGSRSVPAYFGHGVIGDIELDPDTAELSASKRKWIAQIADYEPFAKEVSFRSKAGVVVETGLAVVAKNYWGTGVRQITKANFVAIVSASGNDPGVITSPNEVVQVAQSAETVPLAALWKARSPKVGKVKSSQLSNRRFSKRAKIVGDAAELIFLKHLRQEEESVHRQGMVFWSANAGETPGYDIEDRRFDPPKCYEVKGTVGTQFLSLDLTLNEIECARRLGSRYNLVLVASVLGEHAKITVINDPASLLNLGVLTSTAVTFRIDFIGIAAGESSVAAIPNSAAAIKQNLPLDVCARQ